MDCSWIVNHEIQIICMYNMIAETPGIVADQAYPPPWRSPWKWMEWETLQLKPDPEKIGRFHESTKDWISPRGSNGIAKSSRGRAWRDPGIRRVVGSINESTLDLQVADVLKTVLESYGPPS